MIDEIFEAMVGKIPNIIYLKALIDQLGTEPTPILQLLIKKIQTIIKNADKSDIRPFLDHIMELFKVYINDQSPEVRKAVVFCLVEFHCLFGSEIDPYLQMFTINQQKLVAIYIKRKLEADILTQ